MESAGTVEAPPQGDRDRRSALATIAAVFIVSRLLLVTVAALVESLFPLAGANLSFSHDPILTSLTTSDSVYYLGIAREGYHLAPISGGYHDWVFFPLYPILVRLATPLLLGATALAGVVVANVALLVSLVCLYELSVDRIGHRAALASITFLAMGPGAVAFGMAYSDSLFLALAMAATLAVRHRRDVVWTLLFALAALTRLPGLSAGVLIWLVLVGQDGWRPTRRWVGLLAGPIAVGLFYLYLGQLTGDLLANLHGQAAWDSPALAPATGGSLSTRAHPLFLILLGVLMAYGFLFVYIRADRTPLPEAGFAVATFAIVLASGRILSAPRYLAAAWPFAWALGERRSEAGRILAAGLWAGLFVLFAFLDFTTMLAP